MRELDRGPEIARRRRPRGGLRAPRRSEPSWLRRSLRWVAPSRPADTMATALAAVATAAVLVNALFLQPMPHPAPYFAEPSKPPLPPVRQHANVKRAIPAAPAPVATSAPIPLQRPETAAVQTRSELVADVQRELKGLGFYEGAIDGLRGPRTDQAVRDFEQSQGLKITGEPNAMLLDVMRRARGKPEITGSIAPAPPPAAPRPSTRVLAVQRVLARLGYGPLKLNGLHDGATRTAINQFESDRGIVRTGEIGERLLSELATVTGNPVE